MKKGRGFRIGPAFLVSLNLTITIFTVVSSDKVQAQRFQEGVGNLRGIPVTQQTGGSAVHQQHIGGPRLSGGMQGPPLRRERAHVRGHFTRPALGYGMRGGMADE
jgi:hypothetical protein